MFFDLQASQADNWLFNPYMYAVAGGLSLLSLLWGVERLDRRYWTETGHDFMYGVMYALVYFPVIAICLAAANRFIDAHLPWLRMELISAAPTWVKFLIVVLLDDFLAYWSHRLRHRFRPLWYFHAIHHSQERLNPFTTKRFHPVENLFHKLVILMIPMAVVGGSLEMWYLYFLLDAAWDYFIHSNLRLNLGPLKYLVVTPQFHRVHHSRERAQFDRNFSDRLVIWDHLFGTAHTDYTAYPATGVPDYPGVESGNFLRVHCRDLVYPFRKIMADIKCRRDQVARLS